MPLTMSCPGCRWQLAIPTTAQGKKVRCPKCSLIFASGTDGPAADPGPITDLEEVNVLDVQEAETDVPVLRRATTEERRHPSRAAPPPPSPAKRSVAVFWVVGGGLAALFLLTLCGGVGGYLAYRAFHPAIADRDWSLFSIPDTNASVRLPGPPTRQDLGATDPALVANKWRVSRARENYEFLVVTKKVTNGKQFSSDDFQGQTTSERDGIIRTTSGTLDKDFPVAANRQIGAQFGRQFEIRTANHLRVIGQWYQVNEPDGSRLYGLYVIGPEVQADAGVAAAFLNSFQTGPTPLPTTKPVVPATTTPVKPVEPVKPADPIKPVEPPKPVDVVQALSEAWAAREPVANLAATLVAGDQPGQRLVLDAGPSEITCVALSPDGKTLAVGVNSGPVRLWDAATGQLKAAYDGHKGPVTGMAYSPDGAWLATASMVNRGLRVHDTAKNRAVVSLLSLPNPGTTVSVGTVAFAPDGHTLGAVVDDQLRLWEVPSWTPKPVPAIPGQVRDFAFAPDSKKVAVALGENAVALWDLAADKQLHRLPTSARVQSTPAFSADGSLLGVCAEPISFTVWDVKGGKLQKTLVEQQKPPHGFKRGAFAPDGRTFAAGQGNSVIRLWDVAAGTPRADLRHDRSSVLLPCGVFYTKDGSALVSAGGHRVIFWDVAKLPN